MKLYQNNTIPLEAQYLYGRGLEMIDPQKEDIVLVYLKQAFFIAPFFQKPTGNWANALTGVAVRKRGRYIA